MQESETLKEERDKVGSRVNMGNMVTSMARKIMVGKHRDIVAVTKHGSITLQHQQEWRLVSCWIMEMEYMVCCTIGMCFVLLVYLGCD